MKIRGIQERAREAGELFRVAYLPRDGEVEWAGDLVRHGGGRWGL